MRSSGLEAALQRAWLRRGALALALWPLSMILRLLVGLRESLYMLGLRKPVSLPVPVVVVGNLIAGGAGKTPTVIAVVRCLQAAGRSPGVISRGYGRQADAPPVLEVQPDSPATDSRSPTTTSASSTARWRKPNGPHQLRDGASGRGRFGDNSASRPSRNGAPISHVSCM